MGTTDRFSREEVQRILDLSPRQLDYWDRLRLVPSRKEQGNRFYDFRDLIGLRTVKQLIENGVPANRLGRAVAALREGISHVQAPLTELRVLSNGGDVVVERNGTRLEPLSGQFVMNFDTRELGEKVRVMSGRSAEEWFDTALQCETDSQASADAINAYEQVLRMEPEKVEALINCGTLYYEQGDLRKAADYFRRAVETDSQNALAHANLGSVLEENGEILEAWRHLRSAVRLDPSNLDALYNLALVCEKLGLHAEAREHWLSYVQLDPAGPWNDYARQRLATFPAFRFAQP
ncbi:MAG TPA: tetratricopeptide repeat protein [Candidatus Acidoferrum sp.]|nr:tetratricopeptide repeat protein [Candidatus Acidoferrum sp.]